MQAQSGFRTGMTYSQLKAQYGITLNPQQEAAVQAVDGPVLLLAVPGSGKTTVLVTRLGYMVLCRGIPPERILTMTYTVAATADMRGRCAAIFGQALAEALEFRTINGVSSRIIQYYERSMGRKAFDLVTDERELTALVGELCRNLTGEFATESTVKSIRTWITYIKNMQLPEEEIDKLRADDIKIGPVYRAYCQALRQRRKMDYDDQMVYAWQILKQYPEILAYFQKKYPYLCVDEAQDTSKIQHQIIRLLSSGNLFMVGDEDQSIYGFRAAYPEALLEFDKVHPGAKILLLEQNYRSTAPIVEAANRFIQGNRSRRPKHMIAARGAGPEIRALDVKDRRAQYACLEKMAQNCQVETAVLYRNNDSALPLIDRMSRAGIGYRCRQFDSTFFSHRVVRDITDIIRFAYRPDDGELFLRIYYKLGAGITRSAAEEAAKQGSGVILDILAESPALSQWSRSRCKALQTHLNNLRGDPADKAVYRIVHFMGYGDYMEDKQIDTGKIPILEAIGAAEPNPMRLLSRLEELAVIVQEGVGKPDCRFLLSTIHSSKGLEYERVCLMDVADSILPTCPPVTAATGKPEELRAYEEERRLFYVAMTRAKQELLIFRFRSPELHATFTEELFPKAPAKPERKKSPAKASGRQRPDTEARRQQIRLEAANYHPGDPVRHGIFGPGAITDKQGDIVSIRFGDGQIRRFSLSAVLERSLLNHENPDEKQSGKN